MAILRQRAQAATQVRGAARTPRRAAASRLITAGVAARAAAVLAALCAPALSEQPQLDEYRVKAAFLYNFAKFVEWPPQAFKSPEEPFNICIAGQDPFGGYLHETVSGKTVSGRAFAIRPYAGSHGSGCHILFIAATERRRAHALLDELKSESVLTVGETEDFTSIGGVISLRVEANRVRIDIAVDAAERTRLRISSKLLSLADNARK